MSGKVRQRDRFAVLELKVDLILAEIRELRAERQRRQPVDSARLVAAIAECAGDREFTTGELVRHAPYAEPLRDLLAGMPPKKIGKLFRQIEGQDLDGLCIVRLAAHREGVLWRVCEFGRLGSQTRQPDGS